MGILSFFLQYRWLLFGLVASESAQHVESFGSFVDRVKGSLSSLQMKTTNDNKPTDGFRTYEPLSQDEVSQWLSHIPVYAVTDTEGNGQAIQIGEKSVLYFFLSPIMGEAFKTRIEASNEERNLTIAGLFVGSIWFSMLNDPTSDPSVEYRLVPDPRDLMAVRTILGDESGDRGETSSADGTFMHTYNDIPLFCVNNMPLRNTTTEVKKLLDQMVSSNYMFFSAQNMFDVIDKIANDNGTDIEDGILSLRDVVAMMQEESEIDFRNTVLMPPAPLEHGPLPDSLLADQLGDPSTFASKYFLTPLLEE